MKDAQAMTSAGVLAGGRSGMHFRHERDVLGETPPTGIAWGIDIGGTTTRVGVISDGLIHAARTISTNAADGPESLVRRVGKLARALDAQDARAVGVGVPGLLSDGRMYSARHFSGWDGTPLGGLLANELGRPVSLIGDADAAALGELYSGHHNGARRMLVITIGTGLGISLLHDGAVLGGAGGRMPLGLPAPGNAVELLEDTLSATALLRTAAKLPVFADSPPRRCEELTTPESLADEAVRDLWLRAGDALGWVCAGLGQLFMADKIVVNGGVVQAGEILLDPARRFFREHASFLASSCEIVVSRLAGDAAILGAGSTALAAIAGGSP